MTAATPMSRKARPRLGSVQIEPAAAWLLGFAPTVYLALSGGGYDIIVRSEVGIVLWWLLLLGVVVGVLPRRRLGTSSWVALALFGAFLAWTWIAVNWTESKEQTLAETARVATYLGVLVLGLTLLSRRTLAPLLYGLASAVGLVCILAVISSLVPSWFPADTTARFYETARLAYPFDYSDGVGEFAALGLPLLLFVVAGARRVATRVVAAAVLPAVVLCLVLTASRGGVLASVVGLISFFALAPCRLRRLATLLAIALPSAGLVLALLDIHTSQTVALQSATVGQRHSVLIILGLACVTAGTLEACLTLIWRRATWPRRLMVPRRASLVVTAVMLTTVTFVVLVVIASGTANRLWQEFKQPNPGVGGSHYLRLLSISGSHRYQYWQVAFDAFKAHPLTGIGPGTFQFYWAQHNSLGEFVRNAHSLWMETLAELGIIGLALIATFFGVSIIGGAVRALRAPLAIRLPVATAVAGTAAFCAAAAFDWVWQIGVIPLIAMLLVAVTLAGDGERDRPLVGGLGVGTRIGLGVGALVALWAIVVPLASTIEVRLSETAALHREFRKALNDAATAQNLEPSAASPRLQLALILEQLGDVRGASQAIKLAEAREATNWQIWLVASRIATEADRPVLALADYRRARALNPTSPIFTASRA